MPHHRLRSKDYSENTGCKHTTSNRLRDRQIRRCVVLSDPPSPLRFKLAMDASERTDAEQLVHDAYVESGYITKRSSGRYTTKYHESDGTDVLIGLWDDQVVASVSLVSSRSTGLPLEASLGATFLGTRNTLEVTCLAIASRFRGHKPVLFGLQRFIMRRAIMRGADYLAVAVSPEWMDFYRAVFGAQVISGTEAQSYGQLTSAPAVAGYMDLVTSPDKLRRMYRGTPREHNLYTFLFETEVSNEDFGDADQSGRFDEKTAA